VAQPRMFGDRYELGELIGYGGMAEVHKGRDVRLGREVAIKVLRSDLARDPSFQTRFRREAQAAARLNHPSIVAVYDTGEDIGPNGAVPFIVMEFIDGRTLRDILRAEGSLPATRAMEIVAEICSALDYSHRAGIVHRDIKPANVMITRTGAVKVMDFGIARAVADEAATVTQTAAVIGTAQYLSPEQARGEQVDARSDVYSTGCLLYELVTGRPPFVGDSPVAVAYQHVREVPPLPSTLNAEIPRALDSVIMKALAKNPQNRYQTAGDMGSDLSRILADQPVHAETALTDEERTQFIARPGVIAPVGGVIGFDDDPRDDRPSGRRGAVIWASVVAALLIVIVLVAYLVLRNTDNTPEQVAVPSLVGKTVDQANNALRQAGFQVVANPATSNGPCGDGGEVTPQEGNVCTQDVPAGTRKDEGSAITFTVYAIGTVQVPPVLGIQFDAAQERLAQLGFDVAAPAYVNNAQPYGTVVDQSPKGNVEADKGAVVTLTVSNGKVGVPADLVGKDCNTAVLELNNAGLLKVTCVDQETDNPAEYGKVISVDPAPGAYVPPDSDVTVTVGKAKPTPTPTPTPSVTCTSPGSTPSSTPSAGSTPLPACSSGTPSGGGTPTTSRSRGGGGGGG
jgi:eukaryotic-like serine/threonine-protein kinase